MAFWIKLNCTPKRVGFCPKTKVMQTTWSGPHRALPQDQDGYDECVFTLVGVGGLWRGQN